MRTMATTVEDQMKALQAEIAGIQISVAGLKNQMEKGTEDLTDKANLAFAGHQVKLEQVVMEAARMFSGSYTEKQKEPWWS